VKNPKELFYKTEKKIKTITPTLVYTLKFLKKSKDKADNSVK